MQAFIGQSILKSNRIAIILPYFGKLPETWFLTEQTMCKNTFIDWHIFTDQKLSQHDNISVYKSTFDEFRERVSTTLGFPVALEKPYKICDLRPAFGYIFRDLLFGYAYWGYCDADLVFGDLSNSVVAGIESGCEKIFQRGHLSLLKNVERVNYLFLDSPLKPTYKEVLTHPSNFLFDEAGGFYQMLEAAGMKTYEDNILFDIGPRHFIPRSTTSTAKKPAYIYHDGSIFELDTRGQKSKREGRYIHLQKRPYSVDSKVLNVDQFTDGQAGWFSPISLVPVSLSGQKKGAFKISNLFKGYMQWFVFHLRRKLKKQKFSKIGI